jgi:uncharacterized membrane protein (DUF2068 family)
MQKTHHQGRGLLVIGAFKIVKGFALMAVGFGVLHLLHRDLAAEIAYWVALLRIDPHSHYLQWILEKVANVDRRNFANWAWNILLFWAFLCEGVGLVLRKRWAEYLTILSTASLMPVELLEIYKSISIAKAACCWSTLR